MPQIMREFPRPQIEVEPTEYGMRVITLRRISDANSHVRVTNLVFPHAFVIPMSSEMTITQWHVPIDDTRHYWYAIFTSFGAPVNKDEMRRDPAAAAKITGPAAIDGIGPSEDWQAYWRMTDQARRKAASWASGR